ncbi:two-component system, OmpR family, sensor histidine kinase SenX3 [Arcanobacterium phocae]|uniref:Sensor-like histidine kinase SenX3 n=1 Tax=Arcanobacterium phocae TaxID=131112 RepID=A0A1H2LFM4_9ACTO|nr:ATP-binding protein [Arcanobacterium phocae]SDU79833.1 two-component system, OmpR family, sensor histidine kinase SenX3 [Arcanobacterium phocae]
MHEALSFGLGLVLGAVIIGGIWLTERRIRRHRDDKELQSAKLAMHEQVRLILDTLPQSYIVVDRNHRVVRSSALATAFGLVHGLVLRPELDAIVGDVFASGQTRDTEFDMANRRSRHAVARRIWVRVARASVDKVVVLFEDQTEKIRLENTRRDFVANVSHELKTPIGGIKLLAETISNVSDDVEQVRRFAQALETESDRLSQLVQEIIQLSRLQESDALIDPQIVSIDAVVAEALKRTQLEADARQIDLVSGEESGLTVVGDFLLLVTAVRNLLDNAVRYSNPHSRVSVVVSGTNTEVHIAVIDAGVGISDEAKTRVFERFYRGDEARSRETGGTGLGLSIVKHVVNDHGGQVKLWSELGHGSTFTLVLPRADASAAGMTIPGGENR